MRWDQPAPAAPCKIICRVTRSDIQRLIDTIIEQNYRIMILSNMKNHRLFDFWVILEIDQESNYLALFGIDPKYLGYGIIHHR